MAARGDSIGKQKVLVRAKKRHAQACVQSGRLDEAVTMYEGICALASGDAEAWFLLGALYGRIGNLAGAEACLRKALEVRPDFPQAYVKLGHALERQGRGDEAEASLRAALELKPDMVEAHISLVRFFAVRGDIRAAAACYLRAMSFKPALPSLYLYLSQLLQQQGQLTEAQRSSLHFKLGRLHDEAGLYDRAYAHFQAGNRLQPCAAGIDAAIDKMLRTLLVYNVEAMARAPRAVNCSERPVFIVGMPFSGTVMLEQVLARHPAIAAAGPLRDIADLARELALVPEYDDGSVIDATALKRWRCDTFAQSYLDRINSVSLDALRVTDAMPQNFLQLGLISLLFPMARVIHCTREVRDTALCCYFEPPAGENVYAHDLRYFGQYYLVYQRVMQHWRKVLQIPMMEVTYEELVADTEQVSRKLVRFCNLEWDDACLGRVDDSTIGRWKHYEQHLAPLLSTLAGDY